MPEQRVKGQELELLLVAGGVPLDTIVDFKSFDVTVILAILTEGYLGETTDRKDEIFKGARIRAVLHYENQDVFKLMQAVIDRARRREPGIKINAKATLNMPNGQRPRVQISNLFFGELPNNFASREAYGEINIDAESSDIDFITT